MTLIRERCVEKACARLSAEKYQLPVRRGLGVEVGVAVGLAVVVGVGVTVGVADTVGVGVGVPPPLGNTRTK